MARKYPVTLERSPGFERTKRVLADAEGPLTVRQIAERASISFKSVKDYYIPRLIADKQAHIGGWERYQYGFVPMYSAGSGRKVKRPVLPPLPERCRQWKKRTGYNESYNAYRRAIHRIEKVRDPLMKALMKETSAP